MAGPTKVAVTCVGIIDTEVGCSSSSMFSQQQPLQFAQPTAMSPYPPQQTVAAPQPTQGIPQQVGHLALARCV